MRMFRPAIAALCVAALTASCNGSGDTGSGGGWRTSGANIRIAGVQPDCPTAAPAVDSFLPSPSPNPSCSPSPQPSSDDATPTPAPHWQTVHTEQYPGNESTQENWKTIYTTYTAPPADISAPMVHATEQPMPTPLNTPTPTPLVTVTPLPTLSPLPTQAPVYVSPTATPFP